MVIASTLFVGGIHGVGKTHYCKIIAQRLKIDHASASDLIRQYRESSSTNEKRVGKLEENQDILVYALSKHELKSNILLLDGHFCLLDHRLEMQNVPLQTFVRIAPKTVVVLIDDVEEIRNRLYMRDGIFYSLEFLQIFQQEEVNRAENVCRTLSIPLLIENVRNGIDGVLALINEQISK